MPPWFADPHYGKFANDRSLSETDIKTLVSWVDSGAKAGNPKDAPKPVAFAEGWQIGKPDMVFEVPTPFKVPTSGTVDYQYVRLPTNFTEDKYVQFAEAVPSDREHVHHIIAFIRDPGNPVDEGRADRRAVRSEALPKPTGQGGGEGGGGAIGGDLLAGYAPGTVARFAEAGPGEADPQGQPTSSSSCTTPPTASRARTRAAWALSSRR